MIPNSPNIHNLFFYYLIISVAEPAYELFFISHIAYFGIYYLHLPHLMRNNHRCRRE